jgi:hypothetical protein
VLDIAVSKAVTSREVAANVYDGGQALHAMKRGLELDDVDLLA